MSMKKRNRKWAFTGRWIAVFVAALMLRPRTLQACAACYGKSDSPLASGMNWGILTLLGVVLAVLCGVMIFFVHVIRHEEQTPPEPPADSTHEA